MKQVFRKILKPVERFLATEASSGIVLAACTIIALVVANSPIDHQYHSFLEVKFLNLSVHHWINDGLMTIFFFVVGMEIKRELVKGELSSSKKAALPLLAALGGMVMPALLYYFLNPHSPEINGWGIPMATDIAFAIGVLSFFGKQVPFTLKIFLLALAIVDDLGAVLVIALFYTKEIAGSFMAMAVVVFGTIIFLQRLGVKSYFIYILLGVAAWYFMLRSGVHATIAGVVLGLLTPVCFPVQNGKEETYSPLDELTHKLHQWVSYGIMPIFALANAGVSLKGADMGQIFQNTIHQGIILGLLIGKPLGITLACWIAVKMKIAELPNRVEWGDILGVGFLGGIGFTMALFISGLALSPEQEIFSKTGILIGSMLAALVGAGILAVTLPRYRE